MPNPPQSFFSLEQLVRRRGWWESRGKGNDWNSFCLLFFAHTNTHTHTKKRSPSSLFPLICPTSPVPLLPSFSSQLWLRTHRFLLREIKKREKKEGREREREREREVRGDGMQVSRSRDDCERREATWLMCVCVCARVHSEVRARSCVWCRVFVYFLSWEYNSSAQGRLCLFIFVFQCWGGGREERKRENSYSRNFDRENITNTEVFGAREEAQLWDDINSICHYHLKSMLTSCRVFTARAFWQVCFCMRRSGLMDLRWFVVHVCLCICLSMHLWLLYQLAAVHQRATGDSRAATPTAYISLVPFWFKTIQAL